jgi:hypothetical protein
MIPLILRRLTQLCGEATGFRTNYENLYLMDEIYGDQVSDTLPLGEVSTITYANQQDGFLFREMSLVKAEFGALLEFNCRQEQHRERSPLGSKGKEERPHMDGYTVELEEGWFLTYAGELMYHYSIGWLPSSPRSYSGWPSNWASGVCGRLSMGMIPRTTKWSCSSLMHADR